MHLQLLKAYAGLRRETFAELGGCKQADSERALLVITKGFCLERMCFVTSFLQSTPTYAKISSRWDPHLWFLVNMVCCLTAALE